jgi:hydroxymethylbilane synthase
MSARAVLRIGTRGSALARAQSSAVRDALAEQWPEVEFRLEILKTQGDAWALKAESDNSPAPDKGFFTREFEQALLSGKIDLAVHSLKDLPTGGPSELAIAAVPPRADARDVLVSKYSGGVAGLPPGAVVATGSGRRAAQLHLLRPDARTVPIRGNIDTRLRKLRENPAWHGLVLAAAGLERLYDGALGMEEEAVVMPTLSEFEGLIVTPFTLDQMLPAPAQGALALQARRDDVATMQWAAALDDPATRAAVAAERAFLAGLGGGCQAPVGAHAAIEGGRLDLRGIAWISGDALEAPRQGTVSGLVSHAEEIGHALARQLLEGTP